MPLRAIVKLMGQLMSASLLIFLFDLKIRSFYGVLNIYELDPIASIVLTYFTIIVITNSFNLIDGLDGLAGTIAIIALLTLGIWFFLVEDYLFSILSFSMLGAIFAFLIFNWEPSEVFMGDTGALVIGMMLAILIIHFIDYNYRLEEGDPFRFKASVGTAACFIIIPLADTLRIVILRLSKKQSPFKPDKSHIHHSIMRLGKTHSQTTIILGLIHILFIMLAVIFKEFGELRVLGSIVLLAIVLSIILDRLIINKL